MRNALIALGLIAAGVAPTASAQLIFTQYYEGPSTNKWYEIKNIGSAAIDLSSFTVSLYTNANAENWKTGSTTGAANFVLSGSLSAGSILLVGNTGNTAPFASSFSNNTTANFNGNDSLVLWNNAASFSTSQIVDALSFTNSGNEGADVSFVRTSPSVGYSLTAGAAITSFTSVWTLVALADVNSATAGSDNYLGSSSVSAVPEPSTFAALSGLAVLGATTLRRRRR